MKIKITKIGYLKVEKDGEYQQQYCPFSSTWRPCGHWCPLFSLNTKTEYNANLDPMYVFLELELCRKKYQVLLTENVD